MDGDNILKFPAPKTVTGARVTEMTTLAEDISDLLHGEFSHLDLGELLTLIEDTSGKLYKMGTLLVDDGNKDRLAINLLSNRKLIIEARKHLIESSPNGGR